MTGRGGGSRVEDLPPWADLSRDQQVLSALVFVAAYVPAALLARWFDLAGGSAPWYPPAAITLAFLLIAGPRYVPLVIAVGIATDVALYPDSIREDGVAPILLGATISACAYGWGAWVLRRNRLDRAHVRQFGWFAFVGVAVCPLLASVGHLIVEVTVLGVPGADALEEAGTFWVGDAVAIASIVPFLLLAAQSARHGIAPLSLPEKVSDRIEIFAQALAVVVVPLAIFALRKSGDIAPFLFLSMIPVIWVALRQNLLAASLGILVTNSLVAIGARASLGATDDLVAVQTLMLAAALAALYAGAVRRTEGARLAETVDSQTRYRTLVENSPALVTRFDADGEVLLQAGRLDGEVVADQVSAGLKDRWSELREVLTTATIADVEWSLGTDDAERWLETRAVVEPAVDGTATSLLTVTSDRTAVHRAAEDLARAARRDVVTGLPNRTAAHEWLDAAPGDEATAVLAVLLDDAPTLTAGVGHAIVDQLAVAMADRLHAVDGEARLGRVGRTSFVLVTTAPDDVGRLAGQVLDAFVAPVDLDEPTRVRVSVGTHIPDDEHPTGRLELAELAGRFAQDAGGARVAHFTSSMVDAAADTRSIIHGLRHGIERGELVAHYQPVVELADGRVVGAEALVRWQRPGHGLVGPVEFIEIAEQSGLIDDIGAAVERITAADLLADAVVLPSGFALNLNVSAPQLTNASFAPRMAGVVSSFAAAGIGVHLELTETAIMADPAEACAVLGDLRDHGASIVLDDFGTGFSAISWLHQLPVDAIKLDRSFVTGLPDDDASMRIARLITALANELGLSLTAEGVETEAQRDALLGLGCTQAQGFLFARPEPLDALLARLGPPASPDAITDR